MTASSHQKSLQDAIVGMLESNPEFNLIDDQKVASRESWSYLDRVKKMAKSTRS